YPGLGAVTSDPAQSAAANYAYNASAYSTFATASGIGTATPTGWVFAPGNSTRPFLAFEVPTAAVNGSNTFGSTLIWNAHQLQLIDYSATTLAANYALSANIDMTQTGAALSGNPASYAGLWAPTGFVPLGTDGAGNILNGGSGFTGNLYGQGFTLNNLTINRPTVNDVGLFGLVGAGSVIGNVNITGGAVVGQNAVGVLAGSDSGNIFTVTTSVAVQGTSAVGGLAGSASGILISDSSGSGVSATGTSYIGGLVGYSQALIFEANAYGTVSGTDYVGGLVGGMPGGSILGSVGKASSVTGTGAGIAIGGLVGYQTGGNITYDAAYGSVTGVLGVGGVVGYQSGTASLIYNGYGYATTAGTTDVGGIAGYSEGTISFGYGGNTVSGTSFVGGLVGRAQSGTVSSSLVQGIKITGTNFVGGAVGADLFSATLTSNTSLAVINSTGTYVGGLSGYSEGNISNSTATGAVSAAGQVGGLVGFQESGTITGSSAAGTVTASGNIAGGLVGEQIGGNIASSHASGVTTGANFVGGLVGVQASGG
ncbi:MAG: hypothetical protein KGJ05_08710, partial [Alphaproteobacteria bacterium]|nr:hypothetical protein [Alphaproteobacteria bacterium]